MTAFRRSVGPWTAPPHQGTTQFGHHGNRNWVPCPQEVSCQRGEGDALLAAGCPGHVQLPLMHLLQGVVRGSGWALNLCCLERINTSHSELCPSPPLRWGMKTSAGFAPWPGRRNLSSPVGPKLTLTAIVRKGDFASGNWSIFPIFSEYFSHFFCIFQQKKLWDGMGKTGVTTAQAAARPTTMLKS